MLGKKKYRETENYEIRLKGFYLIESVFDDNKILELDNQYLKLKDENKNNKHYFYFQPLEDKSYLIKITNNNVLGISRTNDNSCIIMEQECKFFYSQKWILKRLDNNVYQIMNKFLKKFLEISEQIDSLVYFSDNFNSDNVLDESYKSFYLWPKESEFELHVSYPFENITKKMLKRKSFLKFLEIDNSIIFETNYNIEFKDCIYLEKIKYCCEHLKYFKNANLIETLFKKEK